MIGRQQIAAALQNGEPLWAMVVRRDGVILCQGFIGWSGSTLEAKRAGIAREIRIDYKGEQFAAPLERPIELKAGSDCQIEFGAKWQ